ncbi:MAG: hypothetical protein ACOC2W_04155 [bacterium]
MVKDIKKVGAMVLAGAVVVSAASTLMVNQDIIDNPVAFAKQAFLIWGSRK